MICFVDLLMIFRREVFRGRVEVMMKDEDEVE